MQKNITVDIGNIEDLLVTKPLWFEKSYFDMISTQEQEDKLFEILSETRFVAFRKLARLGHTEIFIKLVDFLEAYLKVNTVKDNIETMIRDMFWSCSLTALDNHNTDIFKKLVQSRLVDVTYQDQEILKSCVDSLGSDEELEMLKLLLDHPQSNPTDLFPTEMRNVIRDKRFAVFSVLINHPKLPISYNKNFLLRCAEEMQATVFLKALLEKSEVIEAAILYDQLEYLPNEIREAFLF